MKRALLAALALVAGCSNDGSLAQRSCGEGTVLRKNRCEVVGIPVVAYGVPVTLESDPKEGCGRGTWFNGETGQCELLFDAISCGPGTTNMNGECVPPPGALPCAEGTTPKDGMCVPDDQRFECGEGTGLFEGKCVAMTRVQVINEGLVDLDVEIGGEVETSLPPRTSTPYLMLRPSESVSLPSVTSTVLVGGVALPFLVGHDYVLLVTGPTAYAITGRAYASGARVLQVFRNAEAATAFGYSTTVLRNLASRQTLTDYETPPSDAEWIAIGDGLYDLQRLASASTHLLISDDAAVVAYGSNGGVPITLTSDGKK